MKKIELKDDRLGEKLYKYVLASGLEVIVYPKPEYLKKFAFFTTKYGALYNRFTDEAGKDHDLPPGIAHFLEHKIFEDQSGDVFGQFAALGANVNAYTNFNATVYYFSTVDHYKECLKKLVDFVLDLHITPENVEKEKGIITQEIKMYDDDPHWRVYFNGLSAMYQDHPIGIDIAGTVESVQATTLDQLQLAYEKFYSPKNMMLFLIGDFDQEDMLAYVEEILPEEFCQRTSFGKILLPEEPEQVKEERVMQEMDIPMPLFNLFKKGPSAHLDQDHFLESVKVRIGLEALFGRSSNFYEAHYEGGLLGQDFGFEYSYGEGYSYLAIGGETKNPEGLEKAIKEALIKSKEEGLVQADVDRIKKKMLGRYIASFNSTQYIANSFISYYMKNMDLFSYLPMVEALDLGEIEAALYQVLDYPTTISIIK